MQQFNKTLESLESLRLHVQALESYSNNNPLVSFESISFRNIFQEVHNAITLGRNGVAFAKLNIPTSGEFTEVNKLGYNRVKVTPIPVAPGFNGNLLEFLTLSLSVIESLKTLPDDIKTLRMFIGNVLNGSDLLDNLTGNEILDKVKGVDSKVSEKVKSYFKPNLVKEVLFGKIYGNLKEWDSSYLLATKVISNFKQVNIISINDLTNGFKGLLEDLKTSVSKGDLSRKLSSRAVSQLSAKVELVANAITLSAVLQSTLEEVIVSKNQEIAVVLIPANS